MDKQIQRLGGCSVWSAFPLCACIVCVATQRPVFSAERVRLVRSAPGDQLRGNKAARSPLGETVELVDEAANAEGLIDFRKKLRDAVQQRSWSRLRPLLAENIEIEYDGPKGCQAFERMWNPTDRGSRLWDELETILSLGGTLRSTPMHAEFAAPYIHDRWPRGIEDWPRLALAAGASVPVHATASTKSLVIRRLRYEIIRAVSGTSVPRLTDGDGALRPMTERTLPPDPSEWIQIVIRGGAKGYVRRKHIRTQDDYLLWIELIEGKWKLSGLQVPSC